MKEEVKEALLSMEYSYSVVKEFFQNHIKEQLVSADEVSVKKLQAQYHFLDELEITIKNAKEQ